MSIPQQIQIDKLQKEIKDLKDTAFIQPFVQLMLQRIGIELANTPYTEWPNIAKIAFQHSARETPASAKIYYERLPNNEH